MKGFFGFFSLPIPSVSLERLHVFSEEKSISPEMIVKLAWALKSRRFKVQERVTFGYRDSGQDLVVYGLDQAISCYDTVLPCVFNLSCKFLSQALELV